MMDARIMHNAYTFCFVGVMCQVGGELVWVEWMGHFYRQRV